MESVLLAEPSIDEAVLQQLLYHAALCEHNDAMDEGISSASTNGYNADGETHKLWEDGPEDSTFKNNHGCWDFFKAVN